MAHFTKLKPAEISANVREATNERRREGYAARRKIEKNIAAIIDVAIEKAKAGDMRAARLCADKVIGPAKSEPGVKIARINDPDPQVAADSVMEYLARAEINAEQADNYLGAVQKRMEIRLLGMGMQISGEQMMRLVQLRDVLRGRPFAPLAPAVTIGATFGAGN